MEADCPNCGRNMESLYHDDSSVVFLCDVCGAGYSIVNGEVKMTPPKIKECPNCNGEMRLVEDVGSLYYQSHDAKFFHCARCGNDYSVSGGQLNNSKFNDRRAKNASNAENAILLMFISLIIIIGYVIYGVFFASLNFIILGILIFIFIVLWVWYYLSNNPVYYDFSNR